MASRATKANPFKALIIGFGGQIAGRLVDLQWHATHEEFEGGAQQLQAHWLIWATTVFVIAVAARATRQVTDDRERRAYLVVLAANLTYAVGAVIHFVQHLNHLEVDWAHLLLVLTGIAGAIGVLWLIALRIRSRRELGPPR